MNNATPAILEYVAKCPSTGVYLREATEAEVAEYHRANAPVREKFNGLHSFDKAVRVGDVLIDTWTGYGGSHTPGWFL